MKKLLSLLSCILLCSNFLIAQTDNVSKLDEITVSLNANGIQNVAYPFDVPFNLVGSIPEKCIKIIFSYKVSDSEKRKNGELPSWVSLPTKNNTKNLTYQPSSPWLKSPGDEKFSLSCPGIHPNMKYDFQFTLFREVVLTDPQKAALKERLSAEILKFIEKSSATGYTPGDRDALNRKLTTILAAQVTPTAKQTLYHKSDETKPFTIEVNSYSLIKNQFEKLGESAQAISDEKANITGYSTSFQTGIIAVADRILTEIDLINAAKPPLTALSKEILNAPFTPGLQRFKSYTLKDGLKVLRKLAVSPALFDEIAMSRSRILNSDIVATDGSDLESVKSVKSVENVESVESLEFLRSLLSTLEDGSIKITKGNKESPLLQTLDASGKLKAAINSTISGWKKIIASNAKITVIKTEFPDLSADVLLSETLIADVVSIPDVVTDKTPYISAESGIGYSTTFQSAFSYFGANFYLSPVNKRARLRTFKGWNLVKKITSLHLGIANSFGSRSKNSFSVLGEASSSDLLFGLGFRTGRVVKLNLNWIPYKTNNRNPLLNDKKLEFDFAPTIGIDINLLGALGDVASALKLKL